MQSAPQFIVFSGLGGKRSAAKTATTDAHTTWDKTNTKKNCSFL